MVLICQAYRLSLSEYASGVRSLSHIRNMLDCELRSNRVRPKAPLKYWEKHDVLSLAQEPVDWLAQFATLYVYICRNYQQSRLSTDVSHARESIEALFGWIEQSASNVPRVLRLWFARILAFWYLSLAKLYGDYSPSSRCWLASRGFDRPLIG